MRTGWPIIETMLTHERNENLEFFNRALVKMKADITAHSNAEMSAILMGVMDIFGTEFFLDDGTARGRVMSLIGKVDDKEKAFGNALKHYENEGRLSPCGKSYFGYDELGRRFTLSSHLFSKRLIGMRPRLLLMITHCRKSGLKNCGVSS